MPASITFTNSNGADGMEALSHLAENILPSSEAILFAGARQITRIRERTSQGTDVNGNPFAPYSLQSAKARVRKGRNASPVDLLMSGRMLNSMRVEVLGQNEFSITVMDAEAAVYGPAINDGNSRQPRRRFFDTSQAELDAMMRDLSGFGKIR